MVALIEQTPDIYLDEIQEYLSVQHDIDVSLATISRTLHRLGYGSKKVCSFCSLSVWAKLSYSYWNKLRNVAPMHAMISSCRSATNLGNILSAQMSLPSIFWPRIVKTDGPWKGFVLASGAALFVEQGMKSIFFRKAFTQEWLQILPTTHYHNWRPHLQSCRSVLVLDNCRIHHVEGVEEMCEAVQVFSNSTCEAKLTLFPVASNLSSFHRTPLTSIRLRNASLGSKPTSGATAKHSGTLLNSEMMLLLFYLCMEL